VVELRARLVGARIAIGREDRVLAQTVVLGQRDDDVRAVARSPVSVERDHAAVHGRTVAEGVDIGVGTSDLCEGDRPLTFHIGLLATPRDRCLRGGGSRCHEHESGDAGQSEG
jgi:hypothetical protein